MRCAHVVTTIERIAQQVGCIAKHASFSGVFLHPRARAAVPRFRAPCFNVQLGRRDCGGQLPFVDTEGPRLAIKIARGPRVCRMFFFCQYMVYCYGWGVVLGRAQR